MTFYLYTIVFWFFCAIISYGLLYAYFEGEDNYLDDEPYNRRGAFWLSVCGPVSLFLAVIISNCGKSGFSFGKKQETGLTFEKEILSY